MLQDLKLPVHPNWHQHKTKPTIHVSEKLILMYSMTQETDSDAVANQPNIVLLEKQRKKTSIDVTIPIDINMVKAAVEKYKNIRTWRLEGTSNAT
eukprot:5720151-Ditylum_brightwellii.AAC.1